MTRAALKNAEERLRGATLASSVAALDVLLGERVILVGPDGQVLTKEDELDLHRTGRKRVTRYEPSELHVELHGDGVGVVVVRVDMAGELEGAPFAGSFRATRTYVREHDTWRIVCAQLTKDGAAAIDVRDSSR